MSKKVFGEGGGVIKVRAGANAKPLLASAGRFDAVTVRRRLQAACSATIHLQIWTVQSIPLALRNSHLVAIH